MDNRSKSTVNYFSELPEDLRRSIIQQTNSNGMFHMRQVRKNFKNNATPRIDYSVEKLLNLKFHSLANNNKIVPNQFSLVYKRNLRPYFDPLITRLTRYPDEYLKYKNNVNYPFLINLPGVMKFLQQKARTQNKLLLIYKQNYKEALRKVPINGTKPPSLVVGSVFRIKNYKHNINGVDSIRLLAQNRNGRLHNNHNGVEFTRGGLRVNRRYTGIDLNA